jgi:membrane-anchored mycosin MYCP
MGTTEHCGRATSSTLLAALVGCIATCSPGQPTSAEVGGCLDRPVIVAVIDGGIDEGEPDLQEWLAPGWDAVRQRPVTAGSRMHVPSARHGTRVARAVADGYEAVSAANPQGLCLLPITVADERGAVRSEYIASAVDYATDAGASVLNISASAPAPHPAEATAIADSVARGRIITATVGNSGKTAVRHAYPAGYVGVLGVGAVDSHGRVASYSDAGPVVDVFAPGSGTASASVRAGERPGTSFAAGFAAGSLARLIVVGCTPEQAAELLVATGDEVVDHRTKVRDPSGRGTGRAIDVRAALARAGEAAADAPMSRLCGTR